LRRGAGDAGRYAAQQINWFLRRKKMITKNPTVETTTPPIKEQEPSALTVNQVTGERKELISEERIYEENAKVAATFWEWRHKIMTHFFTVLAAVFALTGWFYQQSGVIRIWHCSPLILGAIFSLVSYFFDKRNQRVLRECYRIGSTIELQAREEGGIFNFIHNLHYTRGAFSQTLQALYLISTFLLLGLSTLVIIIAWYGSA
jgi:hypothetical protein